jgi:prefoldin subunit 5
MVTSEELQRELISIRREIDELREHEAEVEIALESVRGSLRWLRAPYAYLLRKSLREQIQSLQLRHNVVHNCYQTVRKDEERKPLEVR